MIFFPPVCTKGPPVSVIAFHGTADAVVPYAGGPIFGVGGSVLYPGVAQGMSGWATRAHCAPTPQITATTAHVTLEQFFFFNDTATTEIYTINGGGHTWPGAFPVPLLGPTTSEINATTIILDAFSRA